MGLNVRYAPVVALIVNDASRVKLRGSAQTNVGSSNLQSDNLPETTIQSPPKIKVFFNQEVGLTMKLHYKHITKHTLEPPQQFEFNKSQHYCFHRFLCSSCIPIDILGIYQCKTNCMYSISLLTWRYFWCNCVATFNQQIFLLYLIIIFQKIKIIQPINPFTRW